MKRILKNINLLNLLLIGAILIFVIYTILPLLNLSVQFTLPSGKKPSVHKDETIDESILPSLNDYTMIAEDNLFHPAREIPDEKADSQPLEQPEFVLYGTLVTDNLRLAYIEDIKAPLNTPGRGRRQKALKIGNIMSGFTLKEIETDRVVMVREEESIIVSLNDPSHPKERTESVITKSTLQPRTQVKAASSKQGGAVSSKSKLKNNLKKSRVPPVHTDIKKSKVQPQRPSGSGGALLFGTTP
jgi:hypothetical protein